MIDYQRVHPEVDAFLIEFDYFGLGPTRRGWELSCITCGELGYFETLEAAAIDAAARHVASPHHQVAASH